MSHSSSYWLHANAARTSCACVCRVPVGYPVVYASHINSTNRLSAQFAGFRRVERMKSLYDTPVSRLLVSCISLRYDLLLAPCTWGKKCTWTFSQNGLICPWYFVQVCLLWPAGSPDPPIRAVVMEASMWVGVALWCFCLWNDFFSPNSSVLWPSEWPWNRIFMCFKHLIKFQETFPNQKLF